MELLLHEEAKPTVVRVWTMKAIIMEEALNKCISQSKFNQEEFQNKLTAVIHHFGLDLQTCKLFILYTICPQTL